jgi:polysaccharide export outer membrane protein
MPKMKLLPGLQSMRLQVHTGNQELRDADVVFGNGESIDLGSPFGKIRVNGESIDETQKEIAEFFAEKSYSANITARLTRVESRPITGRYLVAPDGTINLRAFGSVKVAPMSAREIKEILERHLTQYFDLPEVSVDIVGYNSKVYFVITGGTDKGDNVRKVHITGNETVLDALATVGEPSRLSGKKVWIARPTSSESGEQILPVDFAAITHGGSEATNYQIMPGDRVFIAEEMNNEQTPPDKSDTGMKRGPY